MEPHTTMVPGNIPIAVQLSGPRGPALRLERAKGVSVKNLNKTRKFPERWTEKGELETPVIPPPFLLDDVIVPEHD